MAQIISTVNMKGGVGKTTITVNLAACLAKSYRKRVLVLDLDTQVNATLSLMPPLQFAQLKQEKRTLRTLIDHAIEADLSPSSSVTEIIQRDVCQLSGLDILPGDIELYNDFALAKLFYTQSQEKKLDFERVWNNFENSLIFNILQPVVPHYDFILLDFSPGDHLLTRSGILASDFYIIPAKPEPLSVVGTGLLEGRIRQMKENHRFSQKKSSTPIQLLGIIFTSLGHATNMAPRVKHRLQEEFGKDKIFATEIPTNVAVAQAVDEFQPVFLADPKAPGTKAFRSLTAELLEKLEKASQQ